MSPPSLNIADELTLEGTPSGTPVGSRADDDRAASNGAGDRVFAAMLSRWKSLVGRETTPHKSAASVGEYTTTFRMPKVIILDEPQHAHLVAELLHEAGMSDSRICSDGESAFGFVQRERPDVLLLDLSLWGEQLTMLQRLHDDCRLSHVPTIVLTKTGDRHVKRAALELGAGDFLTKPVDAMDLIPRVRNAWAVKSHQDRLEQQASDLDRMVRERTAELALSRLELIHCLGRAAEYRDNETGRHVVRVGRYCGVIARKMGLDPAMIELIELAAPLHDVGKIGIPDAILRKPGSLAVDEFRIMQSHCDLGLRIFRDASENSTLELLEHPQIGLEFISQYVSPVLRMASSIAANHHEHWDGSGYPRGLKGVDIPLEGRITAVADVFDALSTKRAYKPAYPLEKCFQILREGRGSHFDPATLDAFFAGLDEILDIFREFADVDDDEIVDVSKMH